MRLRLIAVGKIRERYIASACDDFRTRLAPMLPYEETEVRAADGSDPKAAMRDEAARIVAFLRPHEPVWLLERSGEMIDSPTLARRLDDVSNSGVSRLNLVVAGTFGADASLLARATWRWSLSPLTFLHEWARMLVLEQLYRAAKIARNEPYHH
ncbi:MAG: 23S rRNA (pseudouridine(1915)-N(3))-methyltransferase RlmH [Vulcanimicrobiaceae bacterium]